VAFTNFFSKASIQALANENEDYPMIIFFENSREIAFNQPKKNCGVSRFRMTPGILEDFSEFRVRAYKKTTLHSYIPLQVIVGRD